MTSLFLCYNSCVDTVSDTISLSTNFRLRKVISGKDSEKQKNIKALRSEQRSDLNFGNKYINKMALNNKELMTLQEASKGSPYSADYLSLLVRKGRLEGFKKNGKWFTTKNAVEKYTDRVAEASYRRQESLKANIPALEQKKAILNIKWAIALVVIIVLVIISWNYRGVNSESDIKVERDANNNLIIHADNPDDVGSVTVVPK